tara:strand:+ start:331 stop:555 length:225 start_codon:yes stop_codon:yes gene_type:complete
MTYKMKKKGFILPLYCVEIPGTKFRWFPSKEKAIYFTELLYNEKIPCIEDGPIYEHEIEFSEKGICDFLNEREM